MIQGKPPDLDSQNQWYLIQIMASWCSPCTAQRVALEKLLYGNKRVVPIQLMLVSIDEDRKALDKYIEDNDITCPIAWDPGNRLDPLFSSNPPNMIPKYLVLRGHTVYPFDWLMDVVWVEEVLQDLLWFSQTAAIFDYQ